VLPHSVRLSLLIAQLVGVLTLLRSVAFDRWITVLASVLLIAGATAAQRGRTWGVGLAFGAAVAFPVAFLIGIAPAWFCLVGVAGALPLVRTWPAFARFDKGAAALLTMIMAACGAMGAIAWKHVAWSVFSAVPALRPSLQPEHGVLVAALLALAIVSGSRQIRQLRLDDEREGALEGEGIRVASGLGGGVRVASESTLEAEAELEAERAAEGGGSRALRRVDDDR
jgi:hypothetical protein